MIRQLELGQLIKKLTANMRIQAEKITHNIVIKFETYKQNGVILKYLTAIRHYVLLFFLNIKIYKKFIYNNTLGKPLKNYFGKNKH